MVAALLIRLASNDHDLLELEFMKIPCPKRHDETFDGAVNTAYNDMVFDFGVFKRCKCLTDDGSSILRAVHIVVIHHFLVFPLLLIDLVAVSHT